MDPARDHVTQLSFDGGADRNNRHLKVKLSLLALPEDYLIRLGAALDEYGRAEKGVRRGRSDC